MLTLLWHRDDLRLADNPALAAAVRQGAVLPVYIFSDQTGTRPLGGAARWGLHQALTALAASYQKAGTRLILRSGDPSHVLINLVQETGAQAIAWNEPLDTEAVSQDAILHTALREQGLEVQIHKGLRLFEPSEILSQSGTPYRVFTPFSKACWKASPRPSPLLPPSHIAAPSAFPPSDPIASWKLCPTAPNWASGFEKLWSLSEASASEQLAKFLDTTVSAYSSARDFPASNGTSCLSPALRFGILCARQIWHSASFAMDRAPEAANGLQAFLRELLWREFAQHLLFHFPSLITKPMQTSFTAFPWRSDATALSLWQRGQTGYPLVDAGMRQLRQTGWMHNRVRMVVASFLVKHLLVSWQEGEAWFWDNLIDADLANNVTNWQWVAGCGADAAPYFRIFNPVLQSRRFDVEGTYIRRYLPELADMPSKWIHAPWEADPSLCAEKGVILGKTYPNPMINHDSARDRALIAYKSLKKT